MPTHLVSPAGAPYVATDPREANDLRFGHGYRVVEQPKPTASTPTADVNPHPSLPEADQGPSPTATPPPRRRVAQE